MNETNKSAALDLDAIRAKLADARGPQYWRSLEELAETPEFTEFLHREFPENASEWQDPAGRRNFLKLMGASLALAGLSGCTRLPTETIVPYVRPPEEVVPGKPLYFATAMPLSGIATGLLVESHMGRPTKVEGNPEHPASLGATDVFSQAAILGLYDPDRSQVLNNAGRISTWSAFLAAITTVVSNQRMKRGAGVRFLTETVTSPTLAWQLQQLLAEFPGAKWHQYEPAGRHAARAGSMLAFGEYVDTHYRVDRADVIVSLDSDFLTSGPGAVRYAREFASRRRVAGNGSGAAKMNRLYAVESTPSPTGAMADHRLALPPTVVEKFAAILWAGSQSPVSDASEIVLSARSHTEEMQSWIRAIVPELHANRGRSLIVAGEEQSAVVHSLAHAMNHALGNVGSTVIHTAPVEARPVDQFASLRELVDDLNAGAVELLVIVGGNPVYNAPADVDFKGALKKALGANPKPMFVRLGLYDDETSEECHWRVNEAHFLETWSDTRAFDGTVTIQQPLIAPLYSGKSAHEFLAAFTQNPTRNGYDILREYWQKQMPGDFEKSWRRALHDGAVPNTQAAAKQVSYQGDPFSPTARAAGAGEVEIIFRTDPSIYDGRFANNGWLQELPKPLTKLVWDNAALVSPSTARQLGLRNEEVIELRTNGKAVKAVKAAVWVAPGHADSCITAHLGYGRTRAGRIGNGNGFNAYAIRTSNAPWFTVAEIAKTGDAYPLSVTQHHHSIDTSAVKDRVEQILREGTLAEFQKEPNFVQHIGHPPKPELSLYPGFKYEGYAWGMAIDLSACNGCNACVVACQAENNIPVVGKVEVNRGREMHWLRIDRYYKGSPDAPHALHQPMMCQHCENAPCEVVCPVAATVHSSEGLNDMVYNRCVGTRYCSNNCPYKVRRFNFFQYADWKTPSLALMYNPDVTVRSRGVMEKCTYCVQRINHARIEAEKEDRSVRDGEIVTACQQACPTQAIIFGNINDKQSRVAQLKASPLSYGVLTDLQTQPRTTYLAKLRNPNPELET